MARLFLFFRVVLALLPLFAHGAAELPRALADLRGLLYSSQGGSRVSVLAEAIPASGAEFAPCGGVRENLARLDAILAPEPLSPSRLVFASKKLAPLLQAVLYQRFAPAQVTVGGFRAACRHYALAHDPGAIRNLDVALAAVTEAVVQAVVKGKGDAFKVATAFSKAENWLRRETVAEQWRGAEVSSADRLTGDANSVMRRIRPRLAREALLPLDRVVAAIWTKQKWIPRKSNAWLAALRTFNQGARDAAKKGKELLKPASKFEPVQNAYDRCSGWVDLWEALDLRGESAKISKHYEEHLKTAKNADVLHRVVKGLLYLQFDTTSVQVLALQDGGTQSVQRLLCRDLPLRLLGQNAAPFKEMRSAVDGLVRLLIARAIADPPVEAVARLSKLLARLQQVEKDLLREERRVGDVSGGWSVQVAKGRADLQEARKKAFAELCGMVATALKDHSWRAFRTLRPLLYEGTTSGPRNMLSEALVAKRAGGGRAVRDHTRLVCVEALESWRQLDQVVLDDATTRPFRSSKQFDQQKTTELFEALFVVRHQVERIAADEGTRTEESCTAAAVRRARASRWDLAGHAVTVGDFTGEPGEVLLKYLDRALSLLWQAVLLGGGRRIFHAHDALVRAKARVAAGESRRSVIDQQVARNKFGGWDALLQKAYQRSIAFEIQALWIFKFSASARTIGNTMYERLTEAQVIEREAAVPDASQLYELRNVAVLGDNPQVVCAGYLRDLERLHSRVENQDNAGHGGILAMSYFRGYITFRIEDVVALLDAVARLAWVSEEVATVTLASRDFSREVGGGRSSTSSSSELKTVVETCHQAAVRLSRNEPLDMQADGSLDHPFGDILGVLRRALDAFLPSYSVLDTLENMQVELSKDAGTRVSAASSRARDKWFADALSFEVKALKAAFGADLLALQATYYAGGVAVSRARTAWDVAVQRDAPPEGRAGPLRPPVTDLDSVVLIAGEPYRETCAEYTEAMKALDGQIATQGHEDRNVPTPQRLHDLVRLFRALARVRFKFSSTAVRYLARSSSGSNRWEVLEGSCHTVTSALLFNDPLSLQAANQQESEGAFARVMASLKELLLASLPADDLSALARELRLGSKGARADEHGRFQAEFDRRAAKLWDMGASQGSSAGSAAAGEEEQAAAAGGVEEAEPRVPAGFVENTGPAQSENFKGKESNGGDAAVDPRIWVPVLVAAIAANVAGLAWVCWNRSKPLVSNAVFQDMVFWKERGDSDGSHGDNSLSENACCMQTHYSAEMVGV